VIGKSYTNCTILLPRKINGPQKEIRQYISNLQDPNEQTYSYSDSMDIDREIGSSINRPKSQPLLLLPLPRNLRYPANQLHHLPALFTSLSALHHLRQRNKSKQQFPRHCYGIMLWGHLPHKLHIQILGHTRKIIHHWPTCRQSPELNYKRVGLSPQGLDSSVWIDVFDYARWYTSTQIPKDPPPSIFRPEDYDVAPQPTNTTIQNLNTLHPSWRREYNLLMKIKTAPLIWRRARYHGVSGVSKCPYNSNSIGNVVARTVGVMCMQRNWESVAAA